MNVKSLCACALVFVILCINSVALSQELPEAVPDLPVIDCTEPAPYQEPPAAPSPDDPSIPVCTADGEEDDRGPDPRPAPFAPPGEASPQEDPYAGTPEEETPPLDSDDPGEPNRPAYTTTNAAMVGVQTAGGSGGTQGIQAALNVEDGVVPRGTDQYIAQRILGKSCDVANWMEIGWIEAGWRDNGKYIYTHKSQNNAWTFYDQYPLSPGMTIYVKLVPSSPGSNVWSSYLFWNGAWQLLDTETSSSWIGCGSELFVDRYQNGDGSYFKVPNPIEWGDGTPNGVQVADPSTGQWKSWNTSVPTATYMGGPNCWELKGTMWANYFWGKTETTNCPPTTLLDVSPTSGSRTTVFSGNINRTYDSNGDALTTRQIFWGDSSVSNPGPGGLMSHQYANAGSYQVKGWACDTENSCAFSAPISVHVDTSNSAPVTNLTVTPAQGDRSTTFNASLSGTVDPEGDAMTYRIEWGDGTFDNAQQAGHRYRNAGTYTVSGRACDSFGACTTATKPVTVTFSNQPPQGSLTVSPTKGDTTTSFFASMSGSDPENDPLTYSIEWGDGTTSNSQSALHQYETPGSYAVVGTVTDKWGASASDVERVTVCAVYQNGQCVEMPPRDDPPSVYPPQQVAGPVAGLVQRAPDVVKLVRSATNNVMVLDANVLQAYAENNPDYTPRCGANAHKTCNAPLRTTHFADRVEELVRKPASATGDGMGGVVPDVIILQEVLEEQALAISRKLSTRLDSNALDSTYVIAQSRASALVTNESAEIAYCAEKHPPPEAQGVRDQCVRDIQTKGDSAIIYNSATVALVEGTKKFVDNKYDPSERCTAPVAAPPAGFDRDQDNQGDCEFAKWKRQFLAGFAEMKSTGKGFTGYRVAVASTHFVTASHFDNSIVDPVTNEANAIHERKKIEWSNEMADRLLDVMPAPDSFVFGGDLNIHRCTNKAPDDEGDYPDGATCARRGWWESLTTSDQTVAGKGYVDAILAHHAGEASGERLLGQYLDGLDAQGNPDSRTKRIDYIFTRSATVEGTSFDLTCGATSTEAGVLRNCRDFRNDDYYSDHRIVWTLLSNG